MALVRVTEAVRVGLVQRVTRFVSPPNPSGTSSFLWKTDSLSKQKRDLLLLRAMEYRTAFFSSTSVCAQSAGAEANEHEVGSAPASSAVDADVLDRTYGQEQTDHHKVAEDTHAHFEETKNQDEDESLEKTGFDISNVSRPAGGE